MGDSRKRRSLRRTALVVALLLLLLISVAAFGLYPKSKGKISLDDASQRSVDMSSDNRQAFVPPQPMERRVEEVGYSDDEIVEDLSDTEAAAPERTAATDQQTSTKATKAEANTRPEFDKNLIRAYYVSRESPFIGTAGEGASGGQLTLAGRSALGDPIKLTMAVSRSGGLAVARGPRAEIAIQLEGKVHVSYQPPGNALRRTCTQVFSAGRGERTSFGISWKLGSRHEHGGSHPEPVTILDPRPPNGRVHLSSLLTEMSQEDITMGYSKLKSPEESTGRISRTVGRTIKAGAESIGMGVGHYLVYFESNTYYSNVEVLSPNLEEMVWTASTPRKAGRLELTATRDIQLSRIKVVEIVSDERGNTRKELGNGQNRLLLFQRNWDLSNTSINAGESLAVERAFRPGIRYRLGFKYTDEQGETIKSNVEFAFLSSGETIQLTIPE